MSDSTDTRAGDTSGTEGIPDDLDRMDRSPPYLSSGLAVVAGAVAVTASTYDPLALVGSVAGVFLLVAGLATGRRGLVTLASGVLVAAVLQAGTADAPVFATLLGVAAALLAFDLGTTAVDLGEQLGRETPARRLELVHAAASTLVGTGFVLAGFAIHEFATGGQPLSAVFGLVIAAVVLLAALRRADPVR
jgi:hypothetical protein